jgi:hypothetical protein
MHCEVDTHDTNDWDKDAWTKALYLNILKNERTCGKAAVCLLSFLSSCHESLVSKGCLLPVLHFYELVSHI